ncbi:MAG: hypothetical protein A2138_24055 [Deltaproteobacteria bacterium RBG_16_71_12]|nr:MAG: hypothetical protein A2138_24055 [Deltaproteobacteria bacterium RBG_16_71_12]
MVAPRLTIEPTSGEHTPPSGLQRLLRPGDPAPELAARDRRTLELRQFFQLPRKAGEDKSYETHLWLYFPRGFGISHQSWSNEAFYRDATVYMRLHAPSLTLRELADLEHPTSPASVLRRELPGLLDEQAPSASSLETLAKSLGAELADAATVATRSFASRLRALDRPDPAGILVLELSTLCADMLRALAAVRRVRAKARAYRTVAPSSLIPSLAFAEEYAGAVVDERLAELARVIDELPQLRDGQGTAVRMRLVLAKCAEEVVRRRVEQGFPTPAGDAPEYFTYRTGILKKELQRALYVDTRASTRDPFFRNSAAMVAAGLAATWATLAQVPLISGGLTTGQSLLFISLAVGAYVLKDRIKEWVRLALSRRWLRWDHDRHVVGDALAPAGLGSFGGRAQERARWLEPDDIPEEVRQLRARHRTVRGVPPELEHVLEYQRVVRFEAGKSPVPEGFGVQELFRLSLDEILKRLDDPVDEVSYFDQRTGTFATTGMPKVYHLNAIALCVDQASGRRALARWRVVVNQDGILHIDPIVARRRDASSSATSLAPASAA